jgi:hypothetical protein
MQRFKISFWSLLLMVSCSAPGVAQQTLADPADAGLQCGEYYACIASRPLSEAEARSSRGYPPSTPAEIASRDTSKPSETRSQGRSAPMDLSIRQLPASSAF